jgi:2-polyprenyl-6-methoxyphenol hydroxylase-like FAD-dependent oxidoreductase
VVGADGLRSVVARQIGARVAPSRFEKLSLSGRLVGRGPDRERGVLGIGDGVTVGVAPVCSAADLWNATVVVDSRRYRAEVRADAVGLFRSRLATTGPAWEAPPELVGDLLASGPFDQPVRWAARGGVVLVGDAAGYFDPLTGQGVYRALRGAALAAEWIDGSLHERSTGAPFSSEGFSRALVAEFSTGRLLQRAIEATLSRPIPRDLAFRALGRATPAARRLIRLVGDVPRPLPHSSPTVPGSATTPQEVHGAHR